MNSTSRPSLFLVILKWTARTISALMVLMVLIMSIGYAVSEDAGSPPDLKAWILFGIWTVGAIVAWWREGIGGAIILLGTVLALIIQTNAIWPPNPLILFPLAGILFIVYCILDRSRQRKEPA